MCTVGKRFIEEVTLGSHLKYDFCKAYEAGAKRSQHKLNRSVNNTHKGMKQLR